MPLPAAIPPTLEVYYSPACETCRRELAALAILHDHEGGQIRIVILDNDAQARRDVQTRAPSLLPFVEVVDGARVDVLLAAGDKERLLPFARSVTADGQVCARWVGRMTLDKARALLTACKRFGIKNWAAPH